MCELIAMHSIRWQGEIFVFTCPPSFFISVFNRGKNDLTMIFFLCVIWLPGFVCLFAISFVFILIVCIGGGGVCIEHCDFLHCVMLPPSHTPDNIRNWELYSSLWHLYSLHSITHSVAFACFRTMKGIRHTVAIKDVGFILIIFLEICNEYGVIRCFRFELYVWMPFEMLHAIDEYSYNFSRKMPFNHNKDAI